MLLVLDCGIKIPPNPTKKKIKKKQQKSKKQRKTKKKLNKKKRKANTAAKRIVGGKESAPNEWNWQVFLLGKSTMDSFECGGAILSKNFILTAGHCLGM